MKITETKLTTMVIYCLPLWALVLLLPLILLVKRNMVTGRQNKQLPPGPPKLPIIGNLHQLRGSPHRSLSELSKKYGPVMLLQFGCVRSVIISSAEAAEQVLKIHDLHCCSRPPLTGTRKLTYNFSDISFSPYGDYWRQIRKICVVELMVEDQRRWDEDLISHLFEACDKELILSIPLSVHQIEDKLIWMHDKHGKYTACNAYNVLYSWDNIA